MELVKRVWKFLADTVSQTLFVTYLDGEHRTLPLYGREAFEVLTDSWLKAGWANRYSYSFSWLGRPIIQLPQDLMMVQEVLHRVRPDVLVETGVAHGGSGVFFASLFELVGKGRVVSVDIEIRPHSRKAIEEHLLKERICLIEGDSTAPGTVAAVKRQIQPGESVLVFLDSNHLKAHVRAELELYGPLVTPGSYLIATDGNQEDLAEVPGGHRDWVHDNPRAAVREFLAAHPEFEADPEPERLGVTYWPDAYLRRRQA
jgi:cephalosporin hydroxylase